MNCIKNVDIFIILYLSTDYSIVFKYHCYSCFYACCVEGPNPGVETYPFEEIIKGYTRRQVVSNFVH